MDRGSQYTIYYLSKLQERSLSWAVEGLSFSMLAGNIACPHLHLSKWADPGSKSSGMCNCHSTQRCGKFRTTVISPVTSRPPQRSRLFRHSHATVNECCSHFGISTIYATCHPFLSQQREDVSRKVSGKEYGHLPQASQSHTLSRYQSAPCGGLLIKVK